MRVLFAGTPEVAVPSLVALAASDHEVVGVLTRPPAPVGRKRVLTPSPVQVKAEELGLKVIAPSSVNTDEGLAAIEAAGPDIVAVVAYGALLKERALRLPEYGWINLHFSLLPAWRGAAPVQRAIMAGDDLSGASVFQIEAGLDTGPVFGTMTERIKATDTSGDLLRRLAEAGAPLLVNVVSAIESGQAVASPQSEDGMTYAHKLRSEDARIDFSQPAIVVDRHIRGCTPSPGAWTLLDGKRVKLAPVHPAVEELALAPGQIRATSRGVFVGTGTTALELSEISPAGKPMMAATAWARGAHLDEETRFEISAASEAK